MWTLIKVLLFIIITLVLVNTLYYIWGIHYLLVIAGELIVLFVISFIRNSGVLESLGKFLGSVSLIGACLGGPTVYLFYHKGIEDKLLEVWWWLIPTIIAASFTLYNLWMRSMMHLGLFSHYREKVHGAWQFELFDGVRSGLIYYVSRLLLIIAVIGGAFFVFYKL